MKAGQSTIRSFVAIELTGEAKGALAQLQSRLKEIFPQRTVRWTVPKNIHLTLHFLGDVSLDNCEIAGRALQDVATVTPPFSLTLENLGCFPNTRRPRIVWVAVTGETTHLATLHRQLGEHLQKGIGFQPESRPYKPHLTIGRVTKGIAPHQLRNLGQILEREIPKVGQLAALPVDQVHLIRSDLKPSGPIYTRLVDGMLKG